MKTLFRIFSLSSIVFLLLLTAYSKELDTSLPDSDSNTFFINSISGQVWDQSNRPVADIYVELQNELYMTLSRQKTTGAGRFVFTNMSSGTYKIKVLVMGTNYLEQVKDVQILNLLQGSSDQEFVDFHLKLDPRKVTVGSNGQPENIFVQDGIPDSAQKLYRNGAELLSKGDEKGLLEIEKAIQLSPNYFDALNRASTEYVKRKEFAKALPHLVKEIDINRRSFSSFYNLAYVCYQLNHRAARPSSNPTPSTRTFFTEPFSGSMETMIRRCSHC